MPRGWFWQHVLDHTPEDGHMGMSSSHKKLQWLRCSELKASSFSTALATVTRFHFVRSEHANVAGCESELKTARNVRNLLVEAVRAAEVKAKKKLRLAVAKAKKPQVQARMSVVDTNAMWQGVHMRSRLSE